MRDAIAKYNQPAMGMRFQTMHPNCFTIPEWVGRHPLITPTPATLVLSSAHLGHSVLQAPPESLQKI